MQSDSKLILGTPQRYAEVMERSEDSKKPNTAYIERLNLRKRMCCSMLRRRNPAPGRSPQRIQEALELVPGLLQLRDGPLVLEVRQGEANASDAGRYLRSPSDDPRDLHVDPTGGPKWGTKVAGVMARTW